MKYFFIIKHIAICDIFAITIIYLFYFFRKMTFKEKYEDRSESGKNWSEWLFSFLNTMKKKTTTVLSDNNTIDELSIIKNMTPLKKEIINILDACITNDKENIDIEYIEDNHKENKEYEKYKEMYRKNYFLLLKWIKRKLLTNEKILDDYSEEIIKHLEAIKIKKELTVSEIGILLEFILKSYEKSYKKIYQDEFTEWWIGIIQNDMLDFIITN